MADPIIYKPLVGDYANAGTDMMVQGVLPTGIFNVMACVMPGQVTPLTAARSPVLQEMAQMSVGGVEPDVQRLNLKAGASPLQINIPQDKTPFVTSCKVQFEPYQDLHGYSNPWPAGGGKNIINIADTVIDNNWLIINITDLIQLGQAFYASASITDLVGTIQIQVEYKKDGETTCIYGNSFSTATGKLEVSGTIQSFDESTNVQMVIKGQTSASVSDFFMTYSSDHSYAPYSNICPITGWQGATVTVAGKNLLPDVLYQQSSTTVFLGQDAPGFPFALKAGTYTISSVFEGASNVSYYYREENSSQVQIKSNSVSGEGYTFTLPTDGNYRFHMYRNADNGGLTTSQISNVQLEFGSTATSYSPYVAPSSTVITFPSETGTVYAGTCDAVTGVGTISWVLVNANDVSWSNTADEGIYTSFSDKQMSTQTAISDTFNARTYTTSNRVAWTDITPTRAEKLAIIANDNVHIAYKLDTPIPFHCDPSSLTLLKGENWVWAEMITE